MEFCRYEVLDPNININNITIRKKTINTGKRKYNVYNYDKSKLDKDDTEAIKYRSVLFDDNNKLLSYSLPKSKKYDEFIKNNNLNDEDLLITEIIEGTMINLFNNGDKWEISTKSSVGGEYFYYRNGYDKDYGKEKQLTFKKMLYDCLRISDDNEFIRITEDLSKDICYSFVMQHPDNHIVLNNVDMNLYLVAAYKINENKAEYILFNELINMDCIKTMMEFIKLPKIINKLENYKEMELKYTKENNELIVGLMYLNEKTGERCHIINDGYKKRKDIRGNNPNLQYQYLCLKKIGKVKEFLEYFPQYKDLFYKFYIEYKNFLTNIHQSYLTYYIQKNKERVSKKYFYHIYKIHHNIYLPSLKIGKKIMNKGEIFNYFEDYDPIQQLYYLNYIIEE